MHHPSKHDDDEIDSYTEHLLILQVAGNREGRERACLYDALPNIKRLAVDAAIESLLQAGVFLASGERLHQSPALERIDRLDMISA